MPKNLVDTNLIIRFLSQDDPQKASRVEALFRKTTESYFLPDLVVAEVIWVLLSTYKLTKNQVIDDIRSLIAVNSISCNYSLLNHALGIWQPHNISFVDSYLAALAIQKESNLYSFDKDFDKIPTVKRSEP